MAAKVLLSTLLLLVINGKSEGSSGTATWSYEGLTAPQYWAENYPTCGGQSQSPINIETDDVIPSIELGRLSLSGTNQKNAMDITNNGHTAKLTFDEEPTLTGEGLPNDYKCSQLHFHWGKHHNKGSEHQINGKPYAAEMHIVCHSDEYASITEAVHQPNGLAVLSVLIKIGKEDSAFEPVIEALPELTEPESTTAVKPFDIGDLVSGRIHGGYYRYSGSLTTPDCSQTVVWSVLKTPATLSLRQIRKLRSLKRSDGKALVNNFRPVQPLNGRKVSEYLPEEKRNFLKRLLLETLLS